MLVQPCVVVATLDTDSPFRQGSCRSEEKRTVVVLVPQAVMGEEAGENCIALLEVTAVAVRQLPFDPALGVAEVVLGLLVWAMARSGLSMARIQVVTGAQAVV